MATGERYDDPFGSFLLDTWVARSDDGGAWVKQRKLSDTEIIAGSGWFDAPIEKTHSQRMHLPKDVVVDEDRTRATFLSWSQEAQRGFRNELVQRVRSHDVAFT